MVSEDSERVCFVYSSVPTVPVHGEGVREQQFEPFFSEVFSLRHRPYDAGEDEKVSLLRAQERLSFEEWDDPRQQVVPIAYDVHRCGVRARSVVLTYPTARKP
jgi:hypothetical protein